MFIKNRQDVFLFNFRFISAEKCEILPCISTQRCERLKASVVDIIKGNIRIEDEK